LELILVREIGFTIPRSGTDVIAFSEGEEFRIALKSISELVQAVSGVVVDKKTIICNTRVGPTYYARSD
jgi:hypothetical protein